MGGCEGLTVLNFAIGSPGQAPPDSTVQCGPSATLCSCLMLQQRWWASAADVPQTDSTGFQNTTSSSFPLCLCLSQAPLLPTCI